MTDKEKIDVLESLRRCAHEALVDMYHDNDDPEFDATPVLICEKDRSVIIHALMGEGGAQLRVMIDVLMAKEQPNHAALVTAGWVKSPDDFEVRIGECVNVSIEARDGRRDNYYYKVTREPGQPPVLHDPIKTDHNSSGRLSDLFTPEHLKKPETTH